MKKATLILFSFLLLSTTTFAQEGFVFFNGTTEQLETRAENAKKPYFIYFYANWCMPAKEMNHKTFMSKYLTAFAEKNYLGMKVDGESLITEGKMLSEKHKVLYYPTVIIFSPYGKELKRLVGLQTAPELLDELKKYAKNKEKPEVDTTDSLVATPSYESKKGEFLFKVSARTQKHQGFGVQVGVFSSYRNAFARLLELEEEFFHKNILVHIQEKEDGTSVFKLILGPFETEAQTKIYMELLEKKQKIEGIMVELDDLE